MAAETPFTGAVVSVERLIALAAYAGLGEDTSFARSAVGGASGPKRGDGGDIYDLRPFEDGDDPRQIDPAASARSGRTQLRNRHEQVDRTALLVADFRSSMLWGSQVRLRSVAAAEALALEGWKVVAGGGQIGSICCLDQSHESRAPQPREAAMLGISQMMASLHDQAMETAAGAKTPRPQMSSRGVTGSRRIRNRPATRHLFCPYRQFAHARTLKEIECKGLSQ